MKRAEANWGLIFFLAFIKFVLPLFLQSGAFEPQRDEFLYYEQGQHLALGYLENPPFISYLGQISSWLGPHPAWIRIWPFLFGSLTLVITCMITAELGGRTFAQFIAGLGIITGAYMRIHFLFQPNILDIFFWTLSIYFLVRYINTKQEKYIYGIAISLALGWWSKYSILFMAVAIIIALLLSPYRNIFTRKTTWKAIGLAILIILPNLLWQYNHNWPLVHHMNELRETQLAYINRADFIKEQFLFLIPVLFVWITGLVWLSRNPMYRLIAFIYFGVILLLMFGSGKGYYALGAYPMLLAAGGVAIERWSSTRRVLRYAIVVLIIALTMPFIPMLLPIWKPEKLADFYKKAGMDKIGLLKWEDQQDHDLPQDFADMLGWNEMTEKAEIAMANSPDPDSTIVYCRHYGQAGALKFFNPGTFKNKVFTDNGSFLLWIPDSIKFKHLIYIGRKIPEQDDEVFQHFERYTVIDQVENPMSRQFGDKIIFYKNIDSTGLRLAREGIGELKRRFAR